MNKKKPNKTLHKDDSDQKSLLHNHEKFQLGQGYGSGEASSDFHEHTSEKQLGDNPLPKSGGGYLNSGNAQPAE